MIIKIMIIQVVLYVISFLLAKLRSLKGIDNKKTSYKEKIRVFIIILIPFVGLAVILQTIAIVLFLSDEQLVRFLNRGEAKYEVETDD